MHYLQFGASRGGANRQVHALGYILLRNQGGPWDKACREAFGVTPDELMAELRQDLERGELPTYNVSRRALPATSETSVRVLPRSELSARRGEFALAVGQPEFAADLFSSALEGAPDDPLALTGLAEARRALGVVEGLADLYERGLTLGEDQALVQLDYGREILARALGTDDASGAPDVASAPLSTVLDVARQHYARAIELDPGLPEAHALMGYTYFAEGEDVRAAIPHLERAFARVHSDQCLNLKLGLAYAATGDFRSARRVLGLVSAGVHSGRAQGLISQVIQALERSRAPCPTGATTSAT